MKETIFCRIVPCVCSNSQTLLFKVPRKAAHKLYLRSYCRSLIQYWYSIDIVLIQHWQALGLAENAVFKDEVHVIERDIKPGQMERTVFNPADGVIDSFLDGYGCVQGYNASFSRVKMTPSICDYTKHITSEKTSRDRTSVRNVLNLMIFCFKQLF